MSNTKIPNTVSILNGRLQDPANRIDQIVDIHVADGTVAAIGKPPADFTPDLVIDATNLITIPGIIDVGVCLREPGQEYKADIASETNAAATAGITTLCCLPNTCPVIDTPSVVELIKQRAETAAKARVLPIGALTRNLDGEHLSEMAALRDAGCIAVSNGNSPIRNTLVERRALEYAATFNLTCLLQPLDHALRDHGCVHEGKISAKLGLPGILEAAETVALAKSLVLAEQIGTKVHFHTLSTAQATAMLGGSQYTNAQISAGVAIHNLHLTEEHIGEFNSNCHVIPPLRTEVDRAGLRTAVADGRIAIICSDHQPHDPDAKTNPFPNTAPGISGLETLLSLTLDLVHTKVLDLNTAIERITWGPARSLNLPYGRLNVGAVADVCIFDPNAIWQVNTNKFRSRGHNSPFHNWRLPGQVQWTLLAGRVVFKRS
ncbi:dihydroorotase [Achromatium sp. WMS2]|nr:dihydroorotase [Achromatium sp. WMS2]